MRLSPQLRSLLGWQRRVGISPKYGIEAEYIYIPAVAATQALIAGEIQLAQVTGVSTSGAILAGADVRIVASSLNRLVGFIYARPEIKTPEDLKGKKLGISRFGALSETAVGIFLERHGLKRGTDVAILQLGGLPEIVTAMEKGSIEAGFASPPNSSRAKRLGMRELFDIDTLGIELQQTCITVTTKYLREHRPVVKSFVQAYAEGLHRFATDREFSIRVMKKYLRVDEKEMLDDAYAFFSPRLQKIPYPTLKGIKFILDGMAESQPQGKERGSGEFRRSFAASRNRPERFFQAALEKLAPLEALLQQCDKGEFRNGLFFSLTNVTRRSIF